MVRKFVCRHPSCERRIFTEHLPELVAAYARNTTRLVTVLQAIGVALGGATGARLAARLRLLTSAAALLRLVRAAPVPHTPALQVVGVDEWAWRRGHRYGTILVNLADHRVGDLWPDCAAPTVAAWLAEHPITRRRWSMCFHTISPLLPAARSANRNTRRRRACATPAMTEGRMMAAMLTIARASINASAAAVNWLEIGLSYRRRESYTPVTSNAIVRHEE
jgi:hypothetical protein